MPNLLRAKGLYTYSNELSERPEGSLVQADNIVIDKDGVINSRRGFKNYGDTLPTDGDRVKQLIVYKDRIIRHYDNVLEFDNGSGTFTAFSGTYTELETGIRIKYIEVNGNLYFTTDEGVKKISATSADDFSTATNYITTSGGVKALDVAADVKYASGGFLPASSKVAYRVVWGINDENSNLILGSPSSRVVVTNSSEDVSIPEKTEIDTSTGPGGIPAGLDGTFFLINAGQDSTEYFVWYDSTGSTDTPVTSEVVGKTGIRVDISSGVTTLTDVAATTGVSLSGIADFQVEVSGTIITVTTAQGGSTVDSSDSAAAATGFTFNTIQQGTVEEGQDANVDLTFPVPQDVTNTNYFYQIYRTAIVTTSTGVTIDDLEPGDEMNLVIESGVTSAQIAAGEVTAEDVTPDSFRQSGTLLYTNPISGEGILNANEPPPIAKDIALFRNSVFYANTKTAHRKQINLLGVTGFTSGSSKIVIGNSTSAREYTFVGETEISDVVTDTFANTTDGGYFLLNSASNENKYFVWMDKTGSTATPAAGDTDSRIGLRVDISNDSTADEVATSLTEVIDAISDFSASRVGSTVTITNAKNGNTDDITAGLTSPDPGGSAWSFTVTTQGDGEDSASNEVLLSNLTSASQSIDETARSLVKIVNQDSSGIVYAYYLSGSDDLPGIILFESRSLEDDTFYIATNDSSISSKFNPQLSASTSITAISIADPTQVTSVGHGLSTGDSAYIYGTDSTPALLGKYTITKVDNDNFTVPVQVTSAGTTGTVFLADVTSDNEESPNRIYFSKTSQPEAVPTINFLDVGSKNDQIERIVALRDNLFVFKTDGVYIVTGSISPNFTQRLLDNSTNIIAPDSAGVLNNQIYMLSTQGVATVSDTGVGIISRPIEDKILDVTTSAFSHRTASFGLGYENDRSYLLWLPSVSSDTVSTQCYRYNTFTRSWTRWTKTNTCGVIETGEDVMYLGAGDDNTVEKERKDKIRQDFADKEFSLSIVANGVSGSNIRISDSSNAAIGDVILQTQYVTVARFNRLLSKLDRDPGLTDTDYLSTLQIVAGDNLTNKMSALISKLDADDTGETYSFSGTTDFQTIGDEYNDMIDKLNGGSSDSIFVDYTRIENAVEYEAIGTALDTQTNTLTLNTEIPLFEGAITLYKHIDCTVEYAPQHFGNPSLFKQVREGTVIFDGNNFYEATVSYNTDLSKNFEDITFTLEGAGYWGGSDWGQHTWGGEGTDVPKRTLIPRQKQRCRYISCKFNHKTARDIFNLLGISLEVRTMSTRAYR